MRAHADERVARIGAGRRELAVGRLLEVERTVGKHARLVELGAQLRRDGAEILAHHKAAARAAFLGQHCEKIVERVVEVAAAVGLRAPRDPVEARERHHVVHAQRAAQRHVRAQELAERPVAARAQRARRIWRQAPVLALGIELVGRRAASRL